jgi:ribosomal protein S27E
MPNISSCPYPGCRDSDGNPRLTRDVICDASRRHYATIIDRLVLHYVLLRATLPKPVPPPGERVMRIVAREYGHPAEWASDTARSIADHFGETHEALAEHLHHRQPRGLRAESQRVSDAHHYMTVWFEQLCTWPAAGDTAEALVDLDRDVRRGLGKTDPQRHLPVPCPQCELLTLVRSLDHAGTDEVECRACGHVIHAEHYGLWTRMLVDDMLAAAS